MLAHRIPPLLALSLLAPATAGADEPAAVYEDDFADDLGEWQTWTSGGYQATHDLEDGNPAPCLRVAGNSGGLRLHGAERSFSGNEIGKSFFIQFDWRVTADHVTATDIWLDLVAAADGALLWRQNILQGGLLDSGWLTFPPTDLSPYLPEGEPIDVILRPYLKDWWGQNYSQVLRIDNFRLVASELDPPPAVPMQADDFSAGVEPWELWQNSEAAHTYDVRWVEEEQFAEVSGRFTYRRRHGHWGMQRTVPVALPFIVSADWLFWEPIQDRAPATFQLLAADGTLLHTWALHEEEDWTTYAPPDLTPAVLGHDAVTLRLFMHGLAHTNGQDNSLKVDNVAWTEPCDEPRPFFHDGDGDGFGDASVAHPYGDMCHAIPGWVAEAGDCDDGDPDVHPGAVEACNGIDDDCDPTTDERTDADDDGSPGCPAEDCDDADPDVHPGAAEICDGKDNDCDPLTDERVDADSDGSPSCPDLDCDDADPRVHPGAREVCDGKDNDCNPTTTLQGLDVDRDGDGFLACRDDCDDNDASLFPDLSGACGVREEAPEEAPPPPDPDEGRGAKAGGCLQQAGGPTWRLPVRR